MWEEFYEDFHDWLKESQRINSFWENKNADWKSTKSYSNIVGNKICELFQKHFGTDYESMTPEELEELGQNMAKAMKQGYSSTAYFAKHIMQKTFDKAKVGLKPIEPKMDETRLTNIAEKIRDGSTELITESTFKNGAYAAVSDTIEANARFDSESGLKTQLLRTSGGRCCDWCESKAGVFEYGNQPDGFWSVHKDCTCMIEYHVNKTHTRITYNKDNEGNLRKHTQNI